MKPFLAALFVLFCGINLAAAKTVDIPGENITIDIPDTWTPGSAEALTSGNTLLYSAVDPKEGSALMVATEPNVRNASVEQIDSDTYERHVVNDMEVGGGSFFQNSKGITTIDGVPAYAIAFNVEGRRLPAYGHKYIIAANKKFYKIILISFNAGKDSELKDIASSFHFTSPPELPGAAQSDAAPGTPATSQTSGSSLLPTAAQSSSLINSWLRALPLPAGINWGFVIGLVVLFVLLFFVARLFKGQHGIMTGILRLFGFMIAMELLIFSLLGAWIIYDGLHDDFDHADVALVPGYAESKDGTLATSLTARLDRAADLYHKGKFSYVVVSGVTPSNEEDETDLMARYLQDHGVPANLIIQDHRGLKATDTVDNVAGIMKEQNMHSLLLITDYYRMTRLKISLQHAGVKVFEQAHTGEWKKEDGMNVVQEDYNIYKSFYDWYGGPAMELAKADMEKAEAMAKEKMNNTSSSQTQPAPDSSAK